MLRQGNPRLIVDYENDLVGMGGAYEYCQMESAVKRYLQVIHKRQPLYRKLGQAASDDTGWVNLNLEREGLCTLLLE